MRHLFSLFLSILAIAVLPSGCGGASASDLCNKLCTCARSTPGETCTKSGIERCENETEKAAQAADAAGCSSEFQADLDCGVDVTCAARQMPAPLCPDEASALKACLKSSGGN